VTGLDTLAADADGLARRIDRLTLDAYLDGDADNATHVLWLVTEIFLDSASPWRLIHTDDLERARKSAYNEGRRQALKWACK
jgi:hypothetical protein